MKKATEVAFKLPLLAFAIGGGVDGLPSASWRGRRRKRFVVRNSCEVGTYATFRADFLKDTATISGVSAWFHATAFRHFNLLEEAGCTGSGIPWNHKRDCQV